MQDYPKKELIAATTQLFYRAEQQPGSLAYYLGKGCSELFGSSLSQFSSPSVIHERRWRRKM